MKKTLLTLAFVGALLVSCKEKTEDKVDDAVEAVGTEMSDAADSAAVKIDAAADSAAVKVENAAEAGAAKVEAAAKDVKESIKK